MPRPVHSPSQTREVPEAAAAGQNETVATVTPLKMPGDLHTSPHTYKWKQDQTQAGLALTCLAHPSTRECRIYSVDKEKAISNYLKNSEVRDLNIGLLFVQVEKDEGLGYLLGREVNPCFSTGNGMGLLPQIQQEGSAQECTEFLRKILNFFPESVLI